MNLAALQDAILARHRSYRRLANFESEGLFCLACQAKYPCPEYRLASLLTVERVAATLPPWGRRTSRGIEPVMAKEFAAALLDAITEEEI